MRLVSALFDAPVPAAAALAALAAAGFDPAEVTTIPALARECQAGGDRAGPPGDPLAEALQAAWVDEDWPRLAKLLQERGLARGWARLAAEGLRRGAILVLLAVPTLSAPLAAQAMAGAAPPDPLDLAERWLADAELRYPWRDVPALVPAPDGDGWIVGDPGGALAGPGDSPPDLSTSPPEPSESPPGLGDSPPDPDASPPAAAPDGG